MSTFWVIVIIFGVWWIAKSHYSKKDSTSVKNEDIDEEEKEVTEEQVFKGQAYFEKKIYEEIDFPDAITHRDLYMYQSLVRIWYAKLAGENRYNDTMTQRLRKDFLDYMSSLEDRNTYNYLSLELEEESKKDSYREKHITASQKIFAIENGFASAMGEDTVKELDRIRNLDFFMFDKRGNLAPDGFEFDFRGELCPIKK